MSDRTLAVRVEGTVQGVFFRAYASENAKRLGVTGWVANREDGAVEGVLHGPGEALGELIKLLRHGPPEAIVTNIDVRSADRSLATQAPAEAYTF